MLAIRPVIILAVVFGVMSCKSGWAENWPRFRGPTGCGTTTATDLPLTWDAETGRNVRWSTERPGRGIASPIVWEDRVFTIGIQVGEAASGDDEGQRNKAAPPPHLVSAFDGDAGKKLWTTEIEPGPWNRGRRAKRAGGYANPTPCTDGERVYALFGSSVLAAVDFDGELVWRVPIEHYAYDQEMATSPILFEETVIVFCGLKRAAPRLMAFDRRSGDVVYDRELDKCGYGHSTPLIIDVDGRPQMIVVASGGKASESAIQSFDPRTGELSWWCAGRGETASPVFANGLLYCDSGRGGPGCVVDPSGSGDVTATHRKWEAVASQGLSSPLFVGPHVFRLANGVLTCLDAETGERLDQLRVAEIGTKNASPIVDGRGRIYLASAGRTVVLKAGSELEILAVNDLGDVNDASPAVSGSRLLLLGEKRLWCIGE